MADMVAIALALLIAWVGASCARRALWRAVEQSSQPIDCRLTAPRDLKAATAFPRQASDTPRLYQPLSITMGKARSYVGAMAELNCGRGPGRFIEHFARRRENDIMGADHAALNLLTNPMRGPRAL